MYARSECRTNQGLTRLDVVVVIGILGILAVILLGVLPALGKARALAKQINCVNNLKNVGLSLRIFATDHGERWPWQVPDREGGSMSFPPVREGPWRHFVTLSNELSTPGLLWCPMDRERQPAGTFWANPTNPATTVFSGNGQVSYFLGLSATDRNPSGNQADDIVAGDRNLTVDGQSIATGDARIHGGNLLGFQATSLHRGIGQLLKGDGTVWQQRNLQLGPPSSVTNRLLVP